MALLWVTKGTGASLLYICIEFAKIVAAFVKRKIKTTKRYSLSPLSCHVFVIVSLHYGRLVTSVNQSDPTLRKKTASSRFLNSAFMFLFTGSIRLQSGFRKCYAVVAYTGDVFCPCETKESDGIVHYLPPRLNLLDLVYKTHTRYDCHGLPVWQY